jgi:hypothetical protein
MSNHYRPTYGAAEEIFRSSAEQRPFVDLSMTSNVALLPAPQRKWNSGATRWANLVIGIAVDGATERGVPPERIAQAFALGSGVAHATMEFDPELYAADVAQGSPSSPGFEGRVELISDLLTVSGGNPGEEPDTTITFVRQSGVYVPAEATYRVRDDTIPHYVNLSDPFGDMVTADDPAAIPEVFLPFERLGQLEEDVTGGMVPEEPVFFLRGDFSNLQP